MLRARPGSSVWLPVLPFVFSIVLTAAFLGAALQEPKAAFGGLLAIAAWAFAVSEVHWARREGDSILVASPFRRASVRADAAEIRLRVQGGRSPTITVELRGRGLAEGAALATFMAFGMRGPTRAAARLATAFGVPYDEAGSLRAIGVDPATVTGKPGASGRTLVLLIVLAAAIVTVAAFAATSS